MSDPKPDPKPARPTRRDEMTVRIAIALLVIYSVSGLLVNGFSWADIERIRINLGERVFGPMHFRFILQPVMGGIKAWRDGYRDAKTGQPAFGIGLIRNPETRGAKSREALVATAQIILLGLAMDTIYQIIVDHDFHPFEAVLVALLAALLPYLLLRGPFGRIAGWWMHRHSPDA